jgi:hypothetical protein
MNTKKIDKYHKKLLKQFRKINSDKQNNEKKLELYNKQLKIIEKLKSIESKGKIMYETPLSKVAEKIENDKSNLEQSLKNKL